MGDRVCVDTCSMLADGDGMLMGNTSSAMLLVHAETLENPYVAPRPFRVNAGAVHAYILMPDGKTAYLSDLSIGGQVLVSDHRGTARSAIVGRTKIERRPLLLVEAEEGGAKASLILQNAETIRLVAPDGSAISVVNLAAGTYDPRLCARRRQALWHAGQRDDPREVSMKAGIIGGTGKMGRLFAPVFERAGYEMIVSGRSTAVTNADIAETCDLVIVSVPIRDTVRVIGEIAPLLGKDQVLCDFTSLK